MGYSHDEVVGRNPSLCKSNKHPPDFYKGMWKHIVESNPWEGELWDRQKDGAVYPKWLCIDRFADENDQTLFLYGRVP